MKTDQIVATLQKIIQEQLRDCDDAVRAHDPVRALNDVADAKKAIKALIRDLES
jgi:hypothetical protein